MRKRETVLRALHEETQQPNTIQMPSMRRALQVQLLAHEARAAACRRQAERQSSVRSLHNRTKINNIHFTGQRRCAASARTKSTWSRLCLLPRTHSTRTPIRTMSSGAMVMFITSIYIFVHIYSNSEVVASSAPTTSVENRQNDEIQLGLQYQCIACNASFHTEPELLQHVVVHE